MVFMKWLQFRLRNFFHIIFLDYFFVFVRLIPLYLKFKIKFLATKIDDKHNWVPISSESSERACFIFRLVAVKKWNIYLQIFESLLSVIFSIRQNAIIQWNLRHFHPLHAKRHPRHVLFTHMEQKQIIMRYTECVSKVSEAFRRRIEHTAEKVY